MTKRIIVHILPDGRIQAETQGIKGKKCTEYIRVLEEILEAETVDSEYKADYYATEDVTIESTQEQRVQEGN